MLCQACQAEIPREASFCPKCGQRVNGNGSTPAPGTQPTGRNSPPEPERELWRGRYSAKTMVGSWILAGSATLAVAIGGLFVPPPANVFVWLGGAAAVGLLWLYLLGYLILQRLGVSYTLTTQKLMHQTGILRRVTNRIEVIDIDDVTFEQGLVERLFGIGTIVISSSDSTHPKLVMRGIDNVQRIAALIGDTAGQERRKRAAYVERV
ncbi:MAG: PH domain-containing protein [Pirellulaceae bacterium]|nr:PH domain-containing protein [Pirellulaceae bacterium]